MKIEHVDCTKAISTEVEDCCTECHFKIKKGEKKTMIVDGVATEVTCIKARILRDDKDQVIGVIKDWQ